MMSTYRIMYTDETREDVLDVIKNFTNDILIDNAEDSGVTITIQSEESDSVYDQLLEEIGRRVYARR